MKLRMMLLAVLFVVAFSLPASSQNCYYQIWDVQFQCFGENCPEGTYQYKYICQYGGILGCMSPCGWGLCCDTEYSTACNLWPCYPDAKLLDTPKVFAVQLYLTDCKGGYRTVEVDWRRLIVDRPKETKEGI